MILHFWRQLPLQGEETETTRIREFVEWTVKGVAVPVFIWFLINLGFSRWTPPFLSEVDYLKTQAAISGRPWFWSAMGACSWAMTAIVSYWAALSLISITWLIRVRTGDSARFKGTAILWTVLMLPVCAVVLMITGWTGIGFAVVVWLVPVVHGTLRGMVKVRPAPTYSQAIGKLKFGKYSEAEWDIIRELERCENDFNGWLMLAELYAVHFKDFKLAEETVIDLCDQPDLEPSNVCVALHRLADWYLQLQNDPVGARRCMGAITKRYPNTHLDKMARLRMNRLPHSRAEWIEAHRHKPVHLPALHDELDDTGPAAPADRKALQAAAELFSRKLARDPDSAATREEFARALAKLEKLAPAIDQLDLLLAMEKQSPEQRAAWLGLKAAWHAKIDPQSSQVRTVLQHLIKEYPNSPQALAAQRRIFLLDEQLQVAKYAKKQKKPRLVVRLDDPQESTPDVGKK